MWLGPPPSLHPPPPPESTHIFCTSLMDAISLLEAFQRWLVVRRMPLVLPAVVDKQFSPRRHARLYCFALSRALIWIKTRGFVRRLCLVMNSLIRYRELHLEGKPLRMFASLGQDPIAEHAQQDKTSPTEKTRKVNWNGQTWHLFNPLAACGLFLFFFFFFNLQIKSIFNNSSVRSLAFWEVDV